jgi:hypothetical protein
VSFAASAFAPGFDFPIADRDDVGVIVTTYRRKVIA